MNKNMNIDSVLDRLAKFSKSTIQDNMLLKPDSVCIVTHFNDWKSAFAQLETRNERFKEMFVFGSFTPKNELQEISNMCKSKLYAVTFDKSMIVQLKE